MIFVMSIGIVTSKHRMCVIALVYVWIKIIFLHLAFCVFFFFFFLTHAFQLLGDKVYCSCIVHRSHNGLKNSFSL